ncbi:MAG: ComEC/Rec2-related protein [Candidatus Uhrbacteria bacterium GW2011_GWE2_45_35]|uniref:ComEC/Rec2-related protein n=2 Tax=Candidatus Uhriibacteriota TaxID=1752732 RepID=A0A0G1JJD6_9BACT|nr:MAG: ComEC/Rec2-related protein [Candidatus Uhrbacteria bacterium GW2011_GWF2_44_350]KKU08388.1 MAG: ComEC/Rec2-related protein [Candidatus Uhrbacteria bacterium GW2011_GWE2_45_35]HBR80517.1 hypothetical protein [Candidatus Uhrbacteria bacterium]HCU31713.1 hypothetical protein [Candidatus Uhrbacteria bacterium]
MAWEQDNFFKNWSTIAKSPSRSLFIVLLVLLLGLSVKAIFFSEPVSPSVRDYVDKETVITGTIAGEIIQREAAQEITLKNAEIGGELPNGKIMVRLPKFQDFSTGDILEFRCELIVPEPFDGFDYAAYLESRGIYAVCYQPKSLAVQGKAEWNIGDALLSLRLAMIERLGKIFPEPHAAFMSGVLFGGSQGLSQDMKDDFSETGLSHVMAASGYNVSIFSQILLLLLMRSTLGRRRAIIVSGLFVILYIFLAGATPPVIRAGIMATTVMLGTWLGRKPHAGNLLLTSAFLMMVFNPRLISDVGFQLSFAATGGLMLLSSWFGERVKFIPETFGLRESCSASLAAISATLPIMLWHFGSTSFIAPLVNLLVLPWIPYLMLLGGIALGIGWLSIPLGAIVAVPAAALSSFVLLLVTWFGALPFASVTLPKILSATLALGFFVFLLSLTFFEKKSPASNV